MKGMESLKHEIAVKILLEMIVGKSSALYEKLYNEGLINSSFEFDYTCEENYAFSIFGGESPDPQKVRDIVSDSIKGMHKIGIDSSSYNRIKKALTGKFLRQLNSVEMISHTFISVYFKNVNIFDYFEVYDKITFEYVKGVFEEHFNLENFALSVIKPV